MFATATLLAVTGAYQAPSASMMRHSVMRHSMISMNLPTTEQAEITTDDIAWTETASGFKYVNAQFQK